MKNAIQKLLAIRSYARRLPKDLEKRYGRNVQYTPAQICKTVEKLKFNSEWIAYALCMHRRFADISDSHSAVAEKWPSIRSKIGKRFFRGNTEFSSAFFQRYKSNSVGNPNDTLSTAETDTDTISAGGDF